MPAIVHHVGERCKARPTSPVCLVAWVLVDFGQRATGGSTPRRRSPKEPSRSIRWRRGAPGGMVPVARGQHGYLRCWPGCPGSLHRPRVVGYASQSRTQPVRARPTQRVFRSPGVLPVAAVTASGRVQGWPTLSHEHLAQEMKYFIEAGEKPTCKNTQHDSRQAYEAIK